MKQKLSLEVNTEVAEQRFNVAEGRVDDETIQEIGLITIMTGTDPKRWLFRVKLSDQQTLLGIIDCGTISMGLTGENPIYAFCDGPAEMIFEQIIETKHPSVSDETLMEAIKMTQAAARKWERHEQKIFDARILEGEPLLGENGKAMSLARFSKHCYVIAGRRSETITRYNVIFGSTNYKVRKYVVLFGVDSNVGTWKYRFDLYCTKGKTEALKRTFLSLRRMALKKSPVLKFPRLEEISVDYNRKVPICI